MMHLAFIYTEDTSYRSKLKVRIQAAYPDKLFFLAIDANTPEVVINADAIEYAKNIPDLKWPPTVEDLPSDARKRPKSYRIFHQLSAQE